MVIQGPIDADVDFKVYNVYIGSFIKYVFGLRRACRRKSASHLALAFTGLAGAAIPQELS